MLLHNVSIKLNLKISIMLVVSIERRVKIFLFVRLSYQTYVSPVTTMLKIYRFLETSVNRRHRVSAVNSRILRRTLLLVIQVTQTQ